MVIQQSIRSRIWRRSHSTLGGLRAHRYVLSRLQSLDSGQGQDLRIFSSTNLEPLLTLEIISMNLRGCTDGAWKKSGR